MPAPATPTAGLPLWSSLLADQAYQLWLAGTAVEMGVNHWLVVLCREAPDLVRVLLPSVSPQALAEQAREALGRGQAGALLDIRTAAAAAQTEAGTREPRPSDLAIVILRQGGHEPRRNAQQLEAIDQRLAQGGGPSAPPPPTEPTPPRQSAPTSRPGRGGRSGRRGERDSGPLLEQFGIDLTAAAREGKLTPILGRESEVQLVIETLCRRTKRNPALLGPAGVGKTAIAEAVAQRLVAGEAPAMLLGKPLISIPASSLIAGAGIVGSLEERMEKLLAEAKERDVIIFFDELHTLVGAGASGSHPSGSVANMLKPSLARGDFACIAATTDDEYRRYVEPDSALERRFQPIRIQEMTTAQTMLILTSLCERFQTTHGVTVDRRVLSWLIDFAGRFMHNRFFPDKAIDLLEQCVAHATAAGQPNVDRATAEAVAQRLVGMPLDLDERLREVRRRLVDQALLPEAETDALVTRLSVTLRGLDLRPNRPNAVLLLLGDAATTAESVAMTIAGALFGTPERVVTVDLSGYVDAHHVSMLVGSGPGYVGYQDSLPLHRVAQTPWSVLCFDHIDACHPAVREVIRQAISDGYLTLGDGKRLYLSDTVVQLSAALSPEGLRSLGFRQSGGAEAEAAQIRSHAQRSLGESLYDEADVVASQGPQTETQRRRWLKEQILPKLAARYQERRLNVRWAEDVLDWLVNREADGDMRDWERHIENRVAPLLIPYLPQADEDPRELELRLNATGEPEVELLHTPRAEPAGD